MEGGGGGEGGRGWGQLLFAFKVVSPEFLEIPIASKMPKTTFHSFKIDRSPPQDVESYITALFPEKFVLIYCKIFFLFIKYRLLELLTRLDGSSTFTRVQCTCSKQFCSMTIYKQECNDTNAHKHLHHH